ncbi:MAG: ABC transporter substrate-binding protein [Undibacterium sp.]|nr:ABC transporter substrate-binding protein [Undibacterium sp.]
MLTRRSLLQGLLFSCALPSFAHTGQTVRLFLQESLDSRGRQLPIDPKLAQILSYIEHESGMRFEPILLPWKRAQTETLQGNGIIYGFSKSEERLQKYDYSKALITERVWAITYGNPKPNFNTVEDLRGKIVSIGRGFSHGLEFDRAKNVIFTVEEDSATSTARFKKLIAKRSDLMLWPIRQFTQSQEVEAYINQTLIPSFEDPTLAKHHFDISAKPLFFDTVHFASAKGQFQHIIKKIDAVILRGSKNGSLEKALKDYH